MKSSLRSAPWFLSESVRRLFRRLRSCGRVAPILLFPAVLFLPLTAEAGLPRVAISIPTDQNLTVGLKTASQCDVPGKLIVLPPVSFDLAGGEIAPSVFDGQTFQSVPESAELWLRVVMEAGSLAGKESEQEITQRVDAFVKSLPLSAAVVRGLVVEMKEPLRAPDLLAFGLVRLALTAKGNHSGLRLAFVFPPGFVGAHGDVVSRVANYSDLLGITYGRGLARGCCVDCRTRAQ